MLDFPPCLPFYFGECLNHSISLQQEVARLKEPRGIIFQEQVCFGSKSLSNRLLRTPSTLEIPETSSISPRRGGSAFVPTKACNAYKTLKAKGSQCHHTFTYDFSTRNGLLSTSRIWKESNKEPPSTKLSYLRTSFHVSQSRRKAEWYGWQALGTLYRSGRMQQNADLHHACTALSLRIVSIGSKPYA